jgi:peroxiredoxin
LLTHGQHEGTTLRSDERDRRGVSFQPEPGPDSGAPHTQYFPLLSDWNAEAVRGFDVGHDFRGYADVAERTAFLVDTSGTVRGAWRYETAEVPDFDVLLSAAQAL